MTKPSTMSHMTPDDLNNVTINARELFDAMQRVADTIEKVRFDSFDPMDCAALGYQMQGIDMTRSILLRLAYAAIQKDPQSITTRATTIPRDQIRNAGEPVFPVLRQRIVGNVRLNKLIDEREAVGLAKYGQPLMTDDSRDTVVEILGEAGDLLAYTTKLAMQRDTALAWGLVAVTIEFVDDMLAAVEEIESEAQP